MNKLDIHRPTRKRRINGSLKGLNEFVEFLFALGKTWITYLAFLPSLESLGSAYLDIALPFQIPLWSKISFSVVALVLAVFAVWRKEHLAKEQLLAAQLLEKARKPIYDFSASLVPLVKYTDDMRQKAQDEIDWAAAEIHRLPTFSVNSIPLAGIPFQLDRHDYERYIAELNRYIEVLNQVERKGRYKMRCLVSVENSGSMSDDGIRITLSGGDKQVEFIKWPCRILEIPDRPSASPIPNIDFENRNRIPFREVVEADENLVCVELRSLRPGEKAFVLSDGLLLNAEPESELHFEVISKALPCAQVGSFRVGEE